MWKNPDKRTHTIVNVSISLLLHGDFKATVQDLIECVDPFLHLRLAVCSQQVGALILHLKLESKPSNLVVLQRRHGGGGIKRKERVVDSADKNLLNIAKQAFNH